MSCCGVVFAVILCLSGQVEILGFFVALGLSCAWTFDIFPPSTALGLSCARGCLHLQQGDLRIFAFDFYWVLALTWSPARKLVDVARMCGDRDRREPARWRFVFGELWIRLRGVFWIWLALASLVQGEC